MQSTSFNDKTNLSLMTVYLEVCISFIIYELLINSRIKWKKVDIERVMHIMWRNILETVNYMN
jgi:hypothetical protein